jgi:hypothetical protein
VSKLTRKRYLFPYKPDKSLDKERVFFFLWDTQTEFFSTLFGDFNMPCGKKRKRKKIATHKRKKRRRRDRQKKKIR